MPYFVLSYELVNDYVNRRTPFREQHLQLAHEAHRRGELILGGALSDPADRALLVFRVPQRSIVEVCNQCIGIKMGSPAVDGSDRRPTGSCNGAEGVRLFHFDNFGKR